MMGLVMDAIRKIGVFLHRFLTLHIAKAIGMVVRIPSLRDNGDHAWHGSLLHRTLEAANQSLQRPCWIVFAPGRRRQQTAAG